jgi:hypothetical protein
MSQTGVNTGPTVQAGTLGMTQREVGVGAGEEVLAFCGWHAVVRGAVDGPDGLYGSNGTPPLQLQLQAASRGAKGYHKRILNSSTTKPCFPDTSLQTLARNPCLKPQRCIAGTGSHP